MKVDISIVGSIQIRKVLRYGFVECLKELLIVKWTLIDTTGKKKMDRQKLIYKKNAKSKCL